jgi:multidrug resistance efflux pump
LSFRRVQASLRPAIGRGDASSSAVLQRVDIDVDAFPDARLTGMVGDVRCSTAGATEPLPTSSATAEFQKVTQVVPVRVAITDPRGLQLLPGMNVTVRIHRS